MKMGDWECLWHLVTPQVSLSRQQVPSQPGAPACTGAGQGPEACILPNDHASTLLPEAFRGEKLEGG